MNGNFNSNSSPFPFIINDNKNDTIYFEMSIFPFNFYFSTIMSSLMSSNRVLCCDLSGSSAVNSQSKARNEHSSMF